MNHTQASTSYAVGDWGHFIDGVAEPLEAAQGAIVELHNPATGEIIGRSPTCGEGDAERAVRAARRAQPAWASQTVNERRRLVRELSARIEAAAD